MNYDPQSPKLQGRSLALHDRFDTRTSLYGPLLKAVAAIHETPEAIDFAGTLSQVHDAGSVQIVAAERGCSESSLQSAFVKGGRTGDETADIKYLRSLPDASKSIVNVSHGVQPMILPLMQEAWRVLRPGGLLIGEYSSHKDQAKDRSAQSTHPPRPRPAGEFIRLVASSCNFTRLGMCEFIGTDIFDSRRLVAADTFDVSPRTYILIAQKPAPGQTIRKFDAALPQSHTFLLQEPASVLGQDSSTDRLIEMFSSLLKTLIQRNKQQVEEPLNDVRDARIEVEEMRAELANLRAKCRAQALAIQQGHLETFDARTEAKTNLERANAFRSTLTEQLQREEVLLQNLVQRHHEIVTYRSLNGIARQTLRWLIGLPQRFVKRELHWREIELIRFSILFDAQWYYRQYPDVAEDKLDAASHYYTRGAAEMRDPGPWFSTHDYVMAYPDSIGTNPLVHYVRNRPTYFAN